ncbi:MAG: hypothetical protein ACKVY0_01645 [Prosthecobacter sp.]|uniref:hypothetical protein n=1 Tax=Prosthecobacter sp. TaxID=1965333 RepID=UPI0039012932
MNTLRALLYSLAFPLFNTASLHADELLAGVAKIDITDRTGPVNDPCFAKALVLKSGGTTAVLITVDAVAIGEIGRIGNGFLANVRGELERDLGILPASVVINASHCHGIIRADTLQLVVQVVKAAAKNLVPVKAGAGVGSERRISENRRLLMKDGTQVDMRRAYSMPRDEDVESVGPIDPQIGLLRLDRADGTTLAVVYQFACHPIMNPPSKGNSADYPGFASKVIEEALGGGALAFFIQGCGGDINPVRYKEVTRPADAEPLGTMLGAAVLAGVRPIETKDSAVLKVSNEVIAVPRAADYEKRIASIEEEQQQLLAALKPTNINFKAFLPLLLQHQLWPDFPSHHSQSYLHDQTLEKKAIAQLDADNRVLVENYLANIQIMERLTRLNTNLALLKKHLAETKAAAKPTLDVEVCGLRVGDFKLVTFPGEITVQVGLNIKTAAQDANAHVSGYTNGYIYYTPTVEQRNNTGYAQEDCDVLVAPEWQKIFETKALEVLQQLAR